MTRKQKSEIRSKKSAKIAIYGNGGLGREVKNIIDAINFLSPVYSFIGYFDDGKRGNEIIGNLDDLNQWEEEIYLVIGIGKPLLKKKIISAVTNDKVKYETLIHPSVVMGDKCKILIGKGSIITAGTILTTEVNIGNHVLINLNATIGHDALIGDFSSIMPGVNIAGSVKVDPCVLIGSGANIINAAHIGRGATVGSGAVVTKDVAASTTVVGIPARPLKRKYN